MGFSPPVPQDDSNWEIRVAVLLSLFLQVLLIFGGPVRKRSSSSVPRFLVWSCYLLADWVADLALGLMLNNMGNIGGSSSSSSSGSTVQLQHVSGGAAATNSSSPIIFAFWTPFLLLHLGGPDTITAYSVEDNELWVRHLVSLLFELCSASVIFFCSLKSNPLVPATVLMFLVGIVKYGERTYSLYSGSVDGFRAKILTPERGHNYAKLMSEFGSKKNAGLDAEIFTTDCEDARKFINECERALMLKKIANMSLEAWAYRLFLMFRPFFVHHIISHEERVMSQAYFLDNDDEKKAFDVIEVELNFMYDMVYTKAPIAHTKTGCCLRFLGSACIVSSFLIFFFHGKDGFLRVDVAITYVLLLGGLALDAVALLMFLCSQWTLLFLEETLSMARLAKAVRSLRSLWRFRRLSVTTSQLNLISSCLVRDTLRVRVRGMFDDFFCGEEKKKTEEPLFKFVFNSLKERARNVKRRDMKTICGLRGGGVLDDLREKIIDSLEHVKEEAHLAEKKWNLLKSSVTDDVSKQLMDMVMKKLDEEETLTKMKLNLLMDSVVPGREFDESLLLWHIATDLCLCDLSTTKDAAEETKPGKIISKTLSEYMLYLLIKQPEMLWETAGGLIRYQDTREEAMLFFESAAEWDPNHEDARRMLLGVNTSKEPSKVKGNLSKSVLFDGVILAKTLRELGDEALMRKVVAGVWVEMLMYVAGKCRGSTQVKQLNHRGELITIVWILMAHMGLGDMYIREGDVFAKLIVQD